MKITKSTLKRLIKEELEAMLEDRGNPQRKSGYWYSARQAMYRRILHKMKRVLWKLGYCTQPGQAPSGKEVSLEEVLAEMKSALRHAEKKGITDEHLKMAFDEARETACKGL